MPSEPQPDEDCLNLDIDIVYLDSDADYQAALLAKLHPSQRLDEDLEKQVEQLGWYQKELAKLQGEAGKDGTPKKAKAKAKAAAAGPASASKTDLAAQYEHQKKEPTTRNAHESES